MEKTRKPSLLEFEASLSLWMKNPVSVQCKWKVSYHLKQLFSCCTIIVTHRNRPNANISFVPMDDFQQLGQSGERTIKLSVHETDSGKICLTAYPAREHPFKLITIRNVEGSELFKAVVPKEGVFCESEEVGEKLYDYLVTKLPRNTGKKSKPIGRRRGETLH